MTEATYKGSYFCGAVELTVTGKPEGMGHCNSCRAWGPPPSMPSPFGSLKM
jgi:hypothetical protein